MSTFRPGQRIKKVRGSANIGMTALFVDYRPYPNCDPRFDWDCRIELEHDAISTEGKVAPRGCVGNAISSDWEPIIPEGMQPTTWDKCLWQPEGVAA